MKNNPANLRLNKYLSLMLFLSFAVAVIFSTNSLLYQNTYNPSSAAMAPNSITVYAYGVTGSSVYPNLTVRLKKPNQQSEISLGSKRIESKSYAPYSFSSNTFISKGDVLYIDYDNDTSDFTDSKGTCNGSRDVYIWKIIVGDRTFYLDAKSSSTGSFDAGIDILARADSNDRVQRVSYDRANNECGGLYYVGKDRYDFSTYRDFGFVNGKRERGVMYYGDTLWPNGPLFSGQLLWDGSIRVNIDFETGVGQNPAHEPSSPNTQPPSNTQPSNGGTKIIDISKESWGVTYFQNNHEKTSSLKNVSADKINYVPTSSTGIFVRGWPFGPRKYDFSIRWVKDIDFDGRYKFVGKVNDGIRIWVNGTQIFNNWSGKASAVDFSTIEFNATGKKTVEIEYMQKLEDAYLDIKLLNVNVTSPGLPGSTAPIPPATTPQNPGATVPGMTECPQTSSFLYGFAKISDIPRLISTLEFVDPAAIHADLNPFVVRGYDLHAKSDFRLKYVTYDGPTDNGAVQLKGLFRDNRLPEIIKNYKVYDWNWANNTRGGFMAAFGLMDVPATGFKVSSNEEILVPARNSTYPNVTVVYADTNRVSIKYGDGDSLASGYAVELNNICTDINLLRIYRDARKNNKTLPRLKFGDHLGQALPNSNELMVIVRDTGSFIDPRSIKDWWQDYKGQTGKIVTSGQDQVHR